MASDVTCVRKFTRALSLAGSWNFHSSENFDEYMKEIGVGFATRAIGSKVKPTYHISQENNTWTIKMESTFKNSELKFTVGEEFEEGLLFECLFLE